MITTSRSRGGSESGAGGNRTPVSDRQPWRLYACSRRFDLGLCAGADALAFGPATGEPPRQHARKRHALTSPMSSSPIPIGRREGDGLRQAARAYCGSAVVGFVCRLREEHTSRRATPCLTRPIESISAPKCRNQIVETRLSKPECRNQVVNPGLHPGQDHRAAPTAGHDPQYKPLHPLRLFRGVYPYTRPCPPPRIARPASPPSSARQAPAQDSAHPTAASSIRTSTARRS